MSASPLWIPESAKRDQAESTMPSGVLELSDGRQLKEHEVRNQPFRAWQAPDGLTVLAEVKPTAKHGPLLHVMIGYSARRPSWDDVRRVRAVFFGQRDCFIPFGEQDDAEGNLVHLWALPPAWSK